MFRRLIACLAIITGLAAASAPGNAAEAIDALHCEIGISCENGGHAAHHGEIALLGNHMRPIAGAQIASIHPLRALIQAPPPVRLRIDRSRE